MIRFNEVTYAYPGTSKPAVRDLSMEIPDGQFCAVIGPNGAGKSTFAYLIAGFIPHFYHGDLEGEVLVSGKATATTPLSDLIRGVGLIQQNPFNQISGSKVTVREEIAFGLENLGVPRPEMVERVAAAMELVGVADLAERSPLALSGGQMQRVAIASILVMQPPVLVLDEPTAQLDPVGSKEVFATIRKLAAGQKTTVIMIEHKLEWVAEFSDRVLALSGGELLADGSPEEVLTDEALWSKGMGQTRYTQAARGLRQRGIWPHEKPLPVRLEDSVSSFKEMLERG